MTAPKPGTKTKGDQGEAVARAFLLRKGYAILAQNYHSRFGEVDLIAQDGEYIVFIEVKYRKTAQIAPRTAVDAKKQSKIRKTALFYIAGKNLTDTAFRFDVIEVTGVHEFAVEQIENAFC
jgi:putative endonuclease